LHNGLLEDLRITAASADQVGPAFQRALSAVKLRYDGQRLESAD
jgi:carbonic anhydrase